MSFRVVIPARYTSHRLPGKVLLDIGGKPMAQHTYERAVRSAADEVIIATDDGRVAEAARGFGARVCMTSPDHASGTDRIAEVSNLLDWDDEAIVVNVQADEPLIPPLIIDQVAQLLQRSPDASLATLCTPIHSLEEFLDPHVVKVVVARDGAALYFSRAPIPWHREGALEGLASQQTFEGALRHIGLYAYRVGALRQLAGTPRCPVETAEHLEQLRAMWAGMTIQVDIARQLPGSGVDTEQDLQTLRARFEELLALVSPRGPE